MSEQESFDVNAYLRCDCASVENQTCDKCAARGFLASAARDVAFAAKLDAIIAGFTPNERDEMTGFAHDGDRLAVCEGLKAKGLLFQWDRLAPLGGAVMHRMDYLSSLQPAMQAQPHGSDEPRRTEKQK